jgi:amino acid transporter
VSVQNVKRILLGTPIPTAHAAHERLGPLTALAIFASDALSSVAYATEEILLILVLAGSAALELSFPIAIAIAVLIAIVVSSYRQTILAYPQGGGSYVVTRENLGRYPSLVAGAALLVDYVLTVAVSVAAGIAAITSAIRPLYPYRVTLCVLGVALIAVGNLRGVRESGRLFALPTYPFLCAYSRMAGGPSGSRCTATSRCAGAAQGAEALTASGPPRLSSGCAA